MSSMIIVTFLSVAKTRQLAWFQRNPLLSNLITISAYVFIGLVCFCRLYLGRHSLDQIILGCIFGFGTAHFCSNYFRPYMFDPVFCPSRDEDPKVIAARSRKAALWAWCIYFIICVKVVLLYEYVERNAIIP